MSNNKVCKRDYKTPLKTIKHYFVEKTDGAGRKFKVCDKCGVVIVK